MPAWVRSSEAMPSALVACPCGCGARFIPMVADREQGVRVDAQAAATGTRLPAAEHDAVYLITGMPGAGKSTVGRQLAERFDRGAHVDIDMVFHHFTVSGRSDPSHPSEETRAQSRLAVANAAAMARNYAEAGYVCVLEGAITSYDEAMLAARTVEPHPLLLIVLAPPLAVSEERDAERSGKTVAEHFRHLHPNFDSELAGIGVWIDSADQQPSETVDAILRLAEAARVKIADG